MPDGRGVKSMISRADLLAYWWAPAHAAAPGWAVFLKPLAAAYRLLIGLQRAVHRADTPDTPPGRAPVPTVVVGNWVVGGAGKTPTTLALVQHLQGAGWRPGVVSRGYGRRDRSVRLVDATRDRAEEVGDEPLLMARTARIPVAVGRDRKAARDRLLAAHPEVNIVIADDGLQHHRLYRDLSVVVVDERGAGNGQCLPAGPLREPIPAALGERMVLVYSGGRQTLPLPGFLAQRQLRPPQRLGDWAAALPLAPEAAWSAMGAHPVQAAAGVAVPERFFDLLRRQGVDLEATHALPDHDAWTQTPWPPETRDVIVTEKDAVKLAHRGGQGPDQSIDAHTRIWVAGLDLVLPPECLAQVDAMLGPPPT